MHHPTDRVAYTTAFVTPVAEHWLANGKGSLVVPTVESPNNTTSCGTSSRQTKSFMMADEHSGDPLFKILPSLEGEDGTGPSVLTSLLTWEPHPLYTCDSYEDCFRIAKCPELYTTSQREHTTKYIDQDVLPQLVSEGDIQSALSMVMFLHCPHSCDVVRHKARDFVELLLLNAKDNNNNNDYILRLIEEQLQTVLAVNRTTPTPQSANTEGLYLTVLAIMMRGCHAAGKHDEFNAYMKNRKSVMENVKAFRAVRCCEVATALQALKDGNTRQVAILKPAATYILLVWILQELYQKPSSQMFACFLRLIPFMTKRRNSLTSFKVDGKWTSLIMSLAVNGLTSLLIFYFGRVQSNDREEVADKVKAILVSLLPHATLKELQLLLFHKSALLRERVVDIFETFGEFSDNILQANLAMAQRLLTHSLLPAVDGTTKEQQYHDGCAEVNVMLAKRAAIIKFHILPASEHKDGPGANSATWSHEYEASVLREISGHKNIVQLLAFHNIDAYRLPRFYVTEDYKRTCFQDILVTRSLDRDWFSVEHLKSFLLDILSALEYVHQKNIIHRNLTAHSVFIVGESTAKLAGFHIARFQQGTLVEQDCSGIPTRWSAPESLSKRCFSSQSDVWMFGHVMYEVLTHGCLPYSDHQGNDDAAVVQLITESRTPLCHELSIDDDLFHLIRRCTDHETDRRPSLEQIRTVLKQDGRKQMSMSVSDRTSMKTQFPNLKTERTPANRLSWGIPDAPRRPCGGGSAESADSASCGSSSESVEPYTLLHEMNSVLVQEIIPASYPTQVLWSLKNEKDLPGIPASLEIYTNAQSTTLEYQLGKQLAGSLEEVCGNRRYGPDETEFVRDLKTAAETLRDLHNEGWIHGEIQLSNIVIETAPPPSTERKVWFIRLAHMAQLPRDENSQRRSYVQVKESLNRRSYKRSAPEVILNAVYSSASDVFSFAFVIWEVFNFLSNNQQHSTSQFDDLSQNELYGKMASQNLKSCFPCPPNCSTSLYDTIVCCWNVERQQRPTMDDVITELHAEIERLRAGRVNCNSEDDPYMKIDDHPEETHVSEGEGMSGYVTMGYTPRSESVTSGEEKLELSQNAEQIQDIKPPELPPRKQTSVRRRESKGKSANLSVRRAKVFSAEDVDAVINLTKSTNVSDS